MSLWYDESFNVFNMKFCLPSSLGKNFLSKIFEIIMKKINIKKIIHQEQKMH